MMAKNGSSPTAQTIDEIVIDLNQVTRREFNEFWAAVIKAEGNEDELTATFVERVVIGWPFEQDINQASYLALGLIDMQRVDDALLQAIAIVLKKKSQLSLAPLENLSDPLAQS